MLTLPKKFLIIFVLSTYMLLSMFIGTSSIYLPLYVPVSILTIFLLCIIKPVYFINNIVMLSKKTPFKYLILFSLWALFTIIINAIFGTFFIGGFITSTIGGLLTSVLLPIIFICFLCPKYISYKFLIKFLYLFCWFIFTLAIIEFFVYYFDIQILKDIISIFSNRRSFIESKDMTERFFISLFPRTRSVFDEPSYLGYFSFVISPIIYELTLSKFKIFNNTITNNLIKKTMIPFMWISIIFCQSPIFLIGNLIFTLYYFFLYKKGLKKIIILLKKYIILLISGFIFFVIITLLFFKLNNINYEETYLNRIFLTFSNFKSINALILTEPSLATRIISYTNEFILGLKHILFGVGYGNMSYLLNNQLSGSPIPLTDELQLKIIRNYTGANGNIFCKIFSETSFIGIILFYFFVYRVYAYIKRKAAVYNSQDGLIKAFLDSLSLFCITFLISSFYDSNMNFPCFWILFAIIISIINNNKMQKNTLTAVNATQDLKESGGKNE